MQTLWGEFIAWDYLYIAGSVMFSGGPSWETFGFLFWQMMKLDFKKQTRERCDYWSSWTAFLIIYWKINAP